MNVIRLTSILKNDTMMMVLIPTDVVIKQKEEKQ